MADETVHAETGAPHGDSHSNVFPPLDANNFAPQIIWLLITFAALYFMLSRSVLPRIGDIIEERRDRIKRDIDAAARLKADADHAQEAYEHALADARANASVIAQETREKLASEVNEERAKVEQQIIAKTAEAEKRLEATKTEALKSINEIATGTASAVVKQLIDQDVSAEDVKSALQSIEKA